MDYKKLKIHNNITTINTNTIAEKTDNIYKTVVILSKRANQINTEMKEELNSKLEEFSSYTDSLEEVFENREQIEVSKFFEKLPSPTLISIEQFNKDQIYFRKNSEKE